MTAPAASSVPSLRVTIFRPSRISSFSTWAVRISALKCSAWRETLPQAGARAVEDSG
jgi:hypothetical protein